MYKKHYPPALHDEVWRLDRIAKDGALHKKLIKAEIVTVEDFLRLLVKDPQSLRSVSISTSLIKFKHYFSLAFVGFVCCSSSVSYFNISEYRSLGVECPTGCGKTQWSMRKLVSWVESYMFTTSMKLTARVLFSTIFMSLGASLLMGNFSLWNLLLTVKRLDVIDSSYKCCLCVFRLNLAHSDFMQVSVDSLMKRAYENWHQVIEYNGMMATAAPVADHNYALDHNSTATQSRQQYTSELSQQFRIENSQPPVVPQFIPFARSEQTSLIKFNNPQTTTLPSTMGYMSLGGTSNFSADWSRPNYGNGFEDFNVADEIRIRSSEMLESDDMQRLLMKTFSMGVGIGTGSGFGHSDEACYNYSVQYEPHVGQSVRKEHGKSSGKAVVGWLKLKAALRWGIFIRKRAAERRAQLTLTELD